MKTLKEQMKEQLKSLLQFTKLLYCLIQIRNKHMAHKITIVKLTVSIVQTDRMHARDAAIVGATLR